MSANGLTLGFEMSDSLRRAEFESLSTQEKSFQLFSNGKSVEEIVSERKLKADTILSHLSKYVATGEIDPLRLISKEAYDTVKTAILENPGAPDGVIMAKASRASTYGEISVVRAAMEAGIDDI